VRALVFAAVAACGPPAEDLVDGGTDGPSADARPDAPPGCERPLLDAPGLQGYLTNAVATLTTAPRATATQRDAARTKLANELSALGWTPQQHSYAGGINVHASIPATMGNGMRIVVGAHFDTVGGSPGANDNASGCAVVLAIARYLKDTPCRTAPVTIAFFDQEETGLVGSRAFAQTLSAATVRAVHTIDQVAWDADADRVFELELPTTALEQEWRGAAAVVGVSISVTATSGTDHESFRNRGFAAVGLTEEYVGGDTSPHRHLASDTAATVNAPYLVLAAKLTAQVILDEVSP
jgi:acetylornithine deacetylase/succinyl-diaminopimelate desuccinylase-like protein